MQGHVGVCRGMQGHVGVCMGVLGPVGVCRECEGLKGHMNLQVLMGAELCESKFCNFC